MKVPENAPFKVKELVLKEEGLEDLVVPYIMLNPDIYIRMLSYNKGIPLTDSQYLICDDYGFEICFTATRRCFQILYQDECIVFVKENDEVFAIGCGWDDVKRLRANRIFAECWLLRSLRAAQQLHCLEVLDSSL